MATTLFKNLEVRFGYLYTYVRLASIGNKKLKGLRMSAKKLLQGVGYNSGGRLLGVSWHNIKKAWRSQISINGKVQVLGDFDNELDAHNEFLKAKKIYIRHEAIKWKERIDNKVFLSLIEKSESY